MGFAKIIIALTSLACVAVLLTACSGVTIGTIPVMTQPANSGNFAPLDPGPPLVYTAEQLGQESFDTTGAIAITYRRKMIEVKGVVSDLEIPRSSITVKNKDDVIGSILFRVPVTQKGTGQKKDYLIHCTLKEPLKQTDPRAADVAKGKTVTLRGRMAGSDTTVNLTLGDCEVVK